jgi:hypothetical protein
MYPSNDRVYLLPQTELEMKGCYLKKWFKACSVFYAVFSSNLSTAQVVGLRYNTYTNCLKLARDTFLALA